MQATYMFFADLLNLLEDRVSIKKNTNLQFAFFISLTCSHYNCDCNNHELRKLINLLI